MVDILGSLLGHKTSQGGKGGDALNDIFRRGPQSLPGGSKPTDINREAKDLEDLLKVANDRQSGPARGRSTPQSLPPAAAPKPAPGGRQQPGGEQQALILIRAMIRAMINAAKADGQLDRDEQERILKQMHNPTSENIQFLRMELQSHLDVRGFALSVPVGMEQQVYTMSLIAINLDTGEEAKEKSRFRCEQNGYPIQRTGPRTASTLFHNRLRKGQDSTDARPTTSDLSMYRCCRSRIAAVICSSQNS